MMNSVTSRTNRFSFKPINPNAITLTNLVELQVSFTAIRVKRNDYVFVPKLRSICVLDRSVEKVSILFQPKTVILLLTKGPHCRLQDFNAAAIRSLSKKPVSPLKKMKRKVGYEQDGVDATFMGTEESLNMKRLCLKDNQGDHVTDTTMQ